MVTRAYDYVLTVANANNFAKGNIVYGVSSRAYGEIIAKESSNLKVRIANIHKEFSVGESLISNVALLYTVNTFINHTSNLNALANSFVLPFSNPLSDSIHIYINDKYVDPQHYTVNSTSVLFSSNTLSAYRNSNTATANDSMYIQVVTGNINAYSFVSSNIHSSITSANSLITAIYNNKYTAEKNATVQTPIVALYSIYYPGEWYPPNANNNPSNSGDGYAWPYPFPLKYAEFLGETFSDFDYNIISDNVAFKTIALNGDGISSESTGRINETKLEISNFDGLISTLIDNQNLVGYNSSNSAVAYINGELLQNIDPRTVPGNTHFNTSIANQKGINTAWDWASSIANGDTWVPLKEDSRDLLGAVVEIKLTYAKFLDFWPEYSVAYAASGNTISVRSSAPYRIGDYISNRDKSNVVQITNIANNILYVTSVIPNITNNAVFIINPDADSEACVKHTFVVSRLEELNDFVAKFNLTNYMQYFKMELPKRKYYSTCPWVYKGPECKYPQNGSGTIVGSNPTITSNGFFNYNNEPVLNVNEDICSKTHAACALRRNLANFGGFG